MNRRRLMGMAAGSVAAMAMLGNASAQESGAAVTEMIAGGGAVETVLGLVDFGLVARANEDGAVTGSLTLRDFTQPGNPVVMQSTQLNRLEVSSGDAPNVRELVGWVSTGGQTAIFLLQVEDVDGPGSEKDTFRLYVGEAAAPFLEGEEQHACDCADYSYAIEGVIVQGDILVLSE